MAFRSIFLMINDESGNRKKMPLFHKNFKKVLTKDFVRDTIIRL